MTMNTFSNSIILHELQDHTTMLDHNIQTSRESDLLLTTMVAIEEASPLILRAEALY